MPDAKHLDSPERIADEGQRLYAEKHQTKLEKDHLGHFVAINVLTGEAYVAQFPERALEDARAAAPNGVFHLIRIGAPGAFKVSFGTVRNDGFWGRPLRHGR